MKKKIMTLMMGMLLLLTDCGQSKDTATGGEKTTGVVYGPTSSAKVACPCNAEDFVSYMGMYGSVTLYGDSTVTLTVSA